MKKKQFLEYIDWLIGEGFNLFVSIRQPELKTAEIIFNPHENLKAKRDYYEKAYNDELELISFPEIEIVGYSSFGMDINDLVGKVEGWSMDKKLNEAESSKQMLKVVEEVGEVAAALARNDMHELRDGIGDVVVTLIILAQQNGMMLEECLEQAWNEIAERKGEMINGVFVKESDLA